MKGKAATVLKMLLATALLVGVGSFVARRGTGDGSEGGFAASPQALKGAVEYVLGEMRREEVEAQVAEEAALAEDELTVALDLVLQTKAQYEQLRNDGNCVRRQALVRKFLDWRENSNISMEAVVKDALQSHDVNLAEWRKRTGGGLRGDAEHADYSRAMIDDTIAMLDIVESLLRSQQRGDEISIPVCDDVIDQEIFAFGDAVNAVLAQFDAEAERFDRYEAERLARSYAHWYRSTGDTQYLNSLNALAQEHGLNLEQMGIEVADIKEVR